MPARVSSKVVEPQPVISTVTRTVIGIIGIGAGTVTVGIATSLPLPAAAPMLLAAALQLVYGTAVMLGLRVREGGVAVLLAPSVIFTLLLIFANLSFGPNLLLAFGLGSVLNVAAALTVGTALRARWAAREPSRSWTFLLVAALTAGIVGTVATSALAATSAGEHAQAHGGMAGMGMSHR